VTSAALDGLRVIDLTDDSGRFATKLLTEFGADVVRVTPKGSPGVPMVDPAAASRGGVLDWWYDGAKTHHHLDLSTPEGASTYSQLASIADVIVETESPGALNALGVDHSDLIAANPTLVQISLTPFGRTGPRAQWKTSDLVSGAMGGVLSLTGLPDAPLNSWGRQNYNFAGFVAALCAMSGVHAARRDGHGSHVDISIHEVVTSSIENLFMQWFFDDVLPMPKLAQRQGALHWLRAYDLARCHSGHIMITPTPTVELIVQWMLEKGHEEAREWVGLDTVGVLGRIDELMDVIRRFVAKYDAMELWWEAQERHVALGGVHDIPSVAAIPQFAHREFFVDATADGVTVKQPGRLVRMSGTPTAPPGPPSVEERELDDLLASWRPSGSPPEQTSDSPLKPLAGIRVLDFTWVLAGPFATRMFGDLGADVIRVQNEARSTLVNLPDYPYYFVWNRSKRSATLDMKHPRALKMARRLIEQSDVLIENYSAGVLAAWGLDWETVHEWNPRLVYVSMSGCGHDGPWKHVISYAPTVHAVCGLTHLTNWPDRGDIGLGFSLNDHAAGFAAATTTLSALHARERTGEGQLIDMAQLEIGTYLVGPAIIDHFANDRQTQPAGNRDGLQDHVPNEVYPCSSGHVAITVTNTDQWDALLNTMGDPEIATTDLSEESARRVERTAIDEAIRRWVSTRSPESVMETLQAVGVPAGKVQNAQDLAEQDPQHQARSFWQPVDHQVFGARSVDRFPALWDSKELSVDLLSPAYLGEHNFDVWTEQGGLDFDEVAEGIGDGLFS
jgi:crotonobetainyl-CoA:carnitine CoA-transferase CaiB-like acyl-CoA transferase